MMDACEGVLVTYIHKLGRKAQKNMFFSLTKASSQESIQTCRKRGRHVCLWSVTVKAVIFFFCSPLSGWWNAWSRVGVPGLIIAFVIFSWLGLDTRLCCIEVVSIPASQEKGLGSNRRRSLSLWNLHVHSVRVFSRCLCLIGWLKNWSKLSLRLSGWLFVFYVVI